MTGRVPLGMVIPKPTKSVPTGSRLLDTFGRVHNNLRISVTDRCNLRCTYCMPEEVTFRPKDDLLSFEEITHFTRVAATLGVNKVRLTGGEPLMRRDLFKLVELVAEIPGINDVGLTTNGLLLKTQAQMLFDAGLHRLNVSLDTLNDERFRTLTRRDGLDQVLQGLEAAKDVGFAPIKVNAVCIRGFSEEDILPLAHYCRDRGFELRFIEYMPIGADPWERDKVFAAQEIIDLLEHEFGTLQIHPANDASAPALDFDYPDGNGRVGFIASVTRPFCGSCNRLRLTAEGKLRNCLFALAETDIRPLLRERPNDVQLAEIIRQTVWDKWEGHEFNTATFVKPLRTMHAIGG